MKTPEILRGKRIQSEVWLLASVSVAFTSGIAQLVVSGAGRIVLGIIFAAALSLLLIRVVQIQILHRLVGLRYELRKQQWLLRRVADHPTLSYGERVELSYEVGVDASGDRVTEYRETVPRAELLWRNIGLTVSDGLDSDPSLEQVRATWWSEENGGVELEPIPLEGQPGALRVLVLFRPPIVKALKWKVAYFPEGDLWGPLRSRGRDTLRYNTITYFSRKDRVDIELMRVSFLFPPEVTEASVAEDADRGNVDRDTSSGRLVLTWSMESVPPTHFSWTVRVPAWGR